MRGIIGLLLILIGLVMGFTIITGFNPVSSIVSTVTQGNTGTHTTGGKTGTGTTGGEGVLPPRGNGGGQNQNGGND